MKIISPYKDYYDYLTGIYGVDPILVLDRREHTQPGKYGSEYVYKCTLWIGDYVIEGLEWKGNFYFGKDVFNIPSIEDAMTEERRRMIRSYALNRIKSNISDLYNMGYDEFFNKGGIYVSFKQLYQKSRDYEYILSIPIKKTRPTTLDGGIVLGLSRTKFKHATGYLSVYEEVSEFNYKYPILLDIGINKVLSPDDVYRMIVEYLSKRKLEQEYHEDTRSDVQKVEGYGFDKKTSFRNIK